MQNIQNTLSWNILCKLSIDMKWNIHVTLNTEWRIILNAITLSLKFSVLISIQIGNKIVLTIKSESVNLCGDANRIHTRPYISQTQFFTQP